MVPIYKVTTRHTRQVLKDFIKFTYRVKNPSATIRLYTLAGCFFVLAAAVKDFKIQMTVFAVIGIIIFLFTLLRPEIAFSKLAKNDPNYAQQSEILFNFDMGGFVIENKAITSEQKVKYSHITDFYRDTRNYYISVNNEEIHILPYSDFKLGNEKDFAAFIKARTNKDVFELKVSLKEKMKRLRVDMKLAEQQHD
ncbi:MAG: YcxB family protein, partial [Muricomes sp.]